MGEGEGKHLACVFEIFHMVDPDDLPSRLRPRLAFET